MVVSIGGWPSPGRAFLSGPNAELFQRVRSPQGNIAVADINDLGQMVGSGPLSDIPEERGFIADPARGTFIDFGVLFPNMFSDANAINNAGVVVGSMWPDLFIGFDPAAFIYTSANGLQDLTT